MENNLIIYPIDFRIFQSTVKFINYIKENFTHIDFLINNAAQTIRRNTKYYEYLLPIELKKLSKEENNQIVKTEYLGFTNQISDEYLNYKNKDPKEPTKKFEKKKV